MSIDDRDDFANKSRLFAKAMGQDNGLYNLSDELLVAADKYRYAYLWTWMGVPIIQMPPDIIATQEVIWNAKPDVIVETAVARRGSLIFYASMLALLGRGHVIGVDIDIRAHNRDTIERHPMSSRIILISGSSTAADTLDAVRAAIPEGAKVMVVLDSDHSVSVREVVELDESFVIH